MSAPDDYRAKYNPELLKLIPPDAKAVLEVGCGDGILAAMYRMRNPEVEWYGFDVNREAIVEAAKPGRCTFARECDAEREDVYRFNVYEGCNLYRGNPDVLIFGDVLEHMLDPWTALNRIVKDAKPGSLVLASIPNIGHWTVIRGLMKGEFDYADDGLLDRTHLRFFTLKSIKSMFADAGLQVFELRGRRLMNERMDEWARSAGISLTPEMSAFQYVVRAIKRNPTVTEVTRNGDDAAIAETQPPISRLHIHAVVHRCTENGTCCERSRIDEPLAAMATIPGVAAMKTDTPIGIGDDLPDVLIQQRHHVLNIHQQQYVERSIVIAEWDDHPGAFAAQRNADFMALRAVHAVQVSTEALADVVREYNPNVAVFPNQLAALPPWEDKEYSGEINIFFGAQNRREDWRPIMPAINRVIREHRPDNLNFFVIHDKEFFDAIETGQKVFQPFQPYEQYMAILRTCDIALLPLEDTPFNRCKSDIKFLECAAMGVACLMSNTVYGDIWCRYPQGPVAACYRSADGFESGLRVLIDKPDLRRAATMRAYEYVKSERMLGRHYRARLDWYRALLADRERLHRELLERVPRLAVGWHVSQRSAPAPRPTGVQSPP